MMLNNGIRIVAAFRLKYSLNSFLLLLATLLGLTGCFGYGSTTMERSTVVVNDGEGGQAVSFDLTSAAVLQQIIPNSTSQAASQPAAKSLTGDNRLLSVQYFGGTMTIKKNEIAIGTYSVTASVDDSTWSVELYQTFVLSPGTYTFELVLSRTNLQYVGITSFTVVADQTNAIPLLIYPVIGDTLIDVQTVTELGSFKFNYSEIPQLQDFDPSLGVVVDGGSEQVFSINRTTGMTEAYLNLSVGVHAIKLKLYDGQQQKGRSVSTQETQTVIAGQNLIMDIIPIYGELVYAMSVSGADASFDIKIPPEIVARAGSLANLEIPYIINGQGTDYVPVAGEVTQVTYDSSSDVYLGHFYHTGSFYPAIIYIYLSFLKSAESELIGTCTIQSSLNSDQRTSLCEIPVTNSLISSGHLLGTVGITVCEPDGNGDCGTLVSGANLYSLDSEQGDEFLGITDANGFFKTNLKANDYTLRAVSSVDGRFGEVAFTLDPLAVENIEVILNAAAPSNPAIQINGGSSYTFSHYVSLTLSAEDQLGISAYYVSSDATTPGDSDWIAVSPALNFSLTTSFQTSAGTGLKTVYAWFRNVAGHRSERVQASITVQDDTSLYYDNFAFTASSNNSPFDGNGDSWCQGLGSDYRIADWQELKTIVTQNDAVDAADFIAAGGLAPSAGTPILSWWIGAVDPVGAFVSYNGNEDQNGDYFTVTVPSTDSRDIAFGWTPHSESDIVDNGTIGLYTVEATESAKVLCYRDSGVHPLLNGDFADGLNHWEHTAGSAQVINDALALLSFDSIGDSSRVEQSRIAVKPNTGYTITLKAKTSIETRTLAIGIVGGQVNTASYDELPAIWQVDTDRVELAGESSDTGDNYYFDIQLDVMTGAADDELTLFLQFENSGTVGQSATVDTLTLTEN